MPTKFPKITLCNSNPFQTEYALRFLLDVIRENNLTNVLDHEVAVRLDPNEKAHLIDSLVNKAIFKMNNKSFNKSEQKKLGHSLEDMLISCSFNGKACANVDWEWSFHRYRGNCYTFNTGANGNELKYTYLAGSFYGLQVTIYTNLNQNLSFLPKTKGAQIKVENNSYSVDSGNGFDISSGFKTSMALERVFKFSLAHPYSSCNLVNDSPDLEDATLFNMIYKSKYNYEQQFCISELIFSNF